MSEGKHQTGVTSLQTKLAFSGSGELTSFFFLFPLEGHNYLLLVVGGEESTHANTKTSQGGFFPPFYVLLMYWIETKRN